MAEPIRASFLESVDHYLEADDNDPKKVNYLVVAVLVFGFLAPFFWWQARLEIKKGDRFWWLEIVAGVGAAAFAMLFISPTGQRWQLRRRLKKELKDPPTKAWFEFGDDGFISAGRDGQTSFHPWPTIHQAVERAKGTLIYFHKDLYYWVPANAFPNTQLYDAFVKQVAAKVKNFKTYRN